MLPVIQLSILVGVQEHSARNRTPWHAAVTYNSRALLGQALLGLGMPEPVQPAEPADNAATANEKLLEAEQLLVTGYDGMKRREDQIPADGRIRLQKTIQQLVDLFTTLNRPEEVAKYRALLEQE